MPAPSDSFRYRTFFVRASQLVERRQGEFWITNGEITYEKPGTSFLDELGYDGWELVDCEQVDNAFLFLTFKQPFRITT
jgi:hypothetical protein